MKDLNELDYVKHIIREKLPTINFKTYIWAGIRTIPENLNLPGYTSRKHHRAIAKTNPEISEIKIDEIDLKIADALNHDGRASFSKIAKQVGLSTHTVIKRYRGIEKKRGIKSFNSNKPQQIRLLRLTRLERSLHDYTRSFNQHR